MKDLKFASIISIIALIGLVTCNEFPEEDGVLVLDDKNFDKAIQHFDHILVEFYAPWCGHCKQLAPEYAKAAETLKKNNLPLAKVDASINPDLAAKYKVDGFPTMKYFSFGIASEYYEGRTEADIVSFMLKKAESAVKILNSVQEVATFYAPYEATVVYFGDHQTHLILLDRVSRANPNILFGACATKECSSHFGVKSSTIVLFKKFDELRNDFTSEITEELVNSFLTEYSTPLVRNFDTKTIQLIFSELNPGLFLYRDSTAWNTAQLDAIFKSAAKKLRKRIHVIIMDIKDDLETRLADYIGVTAADLPTVRILDIRHDLRKFNMEGEITVENILKFVYQWESGTLKFHLKSQPVPESQDENVYKLVGQTFNEIVLGTNKDVLVFIWAPWCQHSKKLFSIYDELGSKYKHNTNLLIAHIDGTTNEIELMSFGEFPTIKLWPAGKKNTPIEFKGERTVDGLSNFITDHASHYVSEKTDL